MQKGGYLCRIWVGYCRVSTDGQSLDDQIAALKAAGATKRFAEKQSGARSDRPQLRRAIDALGEGDVLLVTRLDRLARSTRDLLNVLHEVGQKGAAFRSLADTWADTSTPHGRLMVTVLGGLAEFECSLIGARTDVGIKRARGRHPLRPAAEAYQTPAATSSQAARCGRAAERGRASAQLRSEHYQQAGCAVGGVRRE
jgi:DNA invertase Pin-like site-specific DNA recombinase